MYVTVNDSITSLVRTPCTRERKIPQACASWNFHILVHHTTVQSAGSGPPRGAASRHGLAYHLTYGAGTWQNHASHRASLLPRPNITTGKTVNEFMRGMSLQVDFFLMISENQTSSATLCSLLCYIVCLSTEYSSEVCLRFSSQHAFS